MSRDCRPLPAGIDRRAFLGLATGTASAALLGVDPAHAAEGSPAPLAGLAARPPAGFAPFTMPGKIVKVSKSNTMQGNGLWPEADAARLMLQRTMEELTGKAELGQAFAMFVNKADKVAIKLNGIAGKTGATMATNKELAVEVVRGVIAAGVPAENIVLFEQYPSFLAGTRCADRNRKLAPEFPAGVTAMVHENKDAVMPEIRVAGIPTKFVRPFTEATAVINLALMKDHGICGYTGCLKNITHGASINPHAFHEHNASPQIAELYAQSVVKSRVRLHITDGFKLIYDEGPLDTNKRRRVLHEALYATTDPVAMDVIGWGVIEEWRRNNGLPTLKEAGREPTYIRVAADLGLGVFDKNRISMREVRL
ncbi:DUF362 domain-containing protein [Chondromyces apiculatus]|uniref:DUF362 domain-containing protein n=1 Tax=Chondromyces apiculatus DSM 436 TaxID=1192034 RepID=A0A017T4A3_9BACT|nr:DUF362 domain-containing protein [Chondromyces apiculatus]EYF03640.1 Hypothetical protein CAP_5431 [Chondromyces apiculatus DSM 436]